MCGRVLYGDSKTIAEKLGVPDSETPREGDANAFPYKGTYVFGIVDKAPEVLRHMQWPLVPSWAKEIPKYNTSNARSEDMDTKPAYRNLLGKRHCIIAVDGFYEWERTGDKNPYYFSMADGSLMKYAGLWDFNKELNILSCTIITREPNEIIGEVHDRMPVILTEEQVKVWLNTKLPYDERAQVLQPIENSALLKRVVGKSVNKAANKSGDWFGGDNPKDCMF
jgi:putative SOS response-associated peptidase YedK